MHVRSHDVHILYISRECTFDKYGRTPTQDVARILLVIVVLFMHAAQVKMLPRAVEGKEKPLCWPGQRKGMRLSQEQIAAMTVQRKAEWNALSPSGLVLRIR